MNKIGTYITITDCANYNGCDVSVHGNGEKIAQQYDVLTHFLISKDPEVIMRVISAWDRRQKHE